MDMMLGAAIGAVVLFHVLLLTRPKNRYSTWVGIAFAALLLTPTNLLGQTLTSALLPLAAFSGLVIFALMFGRRAIHGVPHLGKITAIAAIGLVADFLQRDMDGLKAAGACVLVLAWLAFGLLEDWEKRRVGSFVIATGLFLAALLIAEAFVRRDPIYAAEAFRYGNPFLPQSIRAQATFTQPLVAGAVILFALTAALAQVRSAWFKLAAAGVFLAAIVATGSSSALLIAVVALALAIASRSHFLIKLAALAAVAVAYSRVMSSEGAAVLGGDLSSTTNEHRLNSIRAIPSLFGERSPLEALIGSGWNSTEALYRRGVLINDQFFAIDNQYVALLASCGLVGLVLFAVAMWRLLFNRSVPAINKLPLVAILAMAVAFDILLWPVVVACLAFAAALATVTAPLPTAVEPARPEPSRASTRA